MNIDPAQLEALAAAVAEGTFDGAARSLHVTPSAISQRVKALETSVGRVLLARTKPIRPTPSGESLLRLAQQIRTLTTDIAHELGDDDSPTGVPLAVNADSLATWFLPALAAVDPLPIYDLHRTDEDRTADLLRQGSVMAAVTASAERVPGCTVERLGRMRYRPTAAPTFNQRWFPDGVTPEALSRAPIIVFDRHDRMQDRYLQRRTRRRLDPPRHRIPGSADFLDAVRLGLGWGMIPDLQVTPDRDDLRVIDPRGTIDVRLFWQQWRLQSPVLERVAAAVRTAAGAALR